VIRAKRLGAMTPILEGVLSRVTRRAERAGEALPASTSHAAL
jgi:hypothetical protein